MKILEFFKQQLLIGHIFGIPVRIDYRWFIVLAIVTWLAASNVQPNLIESYTARFVLGLVAALIFFGSIFLHELAHAIAARMESVEVREIVLHPFGGLARFKTAPPTPRAEFRIAIAGPAASFLIALVFLALWGVANSLVLVVLAPFLFHLFFLNILLAVFNLFPGYPLDGGRVLRAYLWRRGYDLNNATVLTGRAGQIIAMALVVFGLFIALLRGDVFTGLWTLLVGLFLFDSAAGIIRQIEDTDKITVGEVMSLPISVAPDALISDFVDNVLPLARQTAFPVARKKQLYGFVVLEDLKQLDRTTWHKTKIQKVMRPVTPDHFTETTTALADARAMMRENDIGVLGIISDTGELVGFLQRGKIRRKV